MARPRNLIPTYRKHSSGRAAVSVYRPDGSRSEILLPGDYGSEESKQEYERLLAQLRANDGKAPARSASPDTTIAELVERFMVEHVEVHYRRPDGKPSGEVRDYALTIRPLVRLFASTPAQEFTPLALRVYRDAIVSASWMTDQEKKELHKRRGHDGTCNRRTANQRVGRVKRLFKWAAEMMIVPASVWHGLQAVAGLQAGRGKARESKEVEPVSVEVVEATLAQLPEIYGDIIKVQLYSGARAGEILKMRTVDIDQDADGEVWVYSPATHKNLWRGHKRKIVFGPKTKLILRKYLRPDEPEVCLFRPGTIRPGGKKEHRQQYSVVDFDKAIGRACLKAGVPHWSSHQLRHLAAQLAEHEVSIEGARAYLGHKTIALTTHYSGLDVKAAAEVARKIG